MRTRNEQRRWVLRCSACIAGLAAISACRSTASAQETNSAMAEALYDAALKLMEAGNDEEACPKLAQSQKLEPAVGTLLYLGLCYERTGKTASAWAAYRSAGEAGRKANQPERQKMAVERARNLEPRLSKLTIRAVAVEQAPGLQILLDGTPLGLAALGVPMPVDPGTHTLAVAAPGFRAWTRSVVVTQAEPDITLAIPALVPETDASTQTTPAAAAKPRPGESARIDGAPTASSTQRTIGIVVAGLGVAGLAVGTVYALEVRSRESEAKDHCTDYPTGCDPIGLEKNEAARDASRWATVGFVAGGAALVGGAVLYFTAPSEGPRAGAVRVQPGLARHEAGVLVRGSF